MPSVGACSPPGHSASSRSSSSRASAAVTGSPSTSTGSLPMPGAPAAADSRVSSEATTSRWALTAGPLLRRAGHPVHQDRGAQLTDRPLVAGLLERAGVRVDLGAHRRHVRPSHRGAQLAHAVAKTARGDVSVALGVLPAEVGRSRIGLDQLLPHQSAQPGDREVGGLRQHDRLDRRQHVVRGLPRRPAELGGDGPRSGRVQPPVGQRSPCGGQPVQQRRRPLPQLGRRRP